ncbi:10023_t:CDS:10 [Acaulospora colombiana]|uniref:10023_t:CDS:1 n=1 Tax=Acaulospora colombiana TaxID=27376 RepID=A0ACA9L9X4_9GLOM|nr:10023_t:CDS:10 [Acaulospora colombiana]
MSFPLHALATSPLSKTSPFVTMRVDHRDSEITDERSRELLRQIVVVPKFIRTTIGFEFENLIDEGHRESEFYENLSKFFVLEKSCDADYLIPELANVVAVKWSSESQIAKQITGGLLYLHENNIVHGNLLERTRGASRVISRSSGSIACLTQPYLKISDGVVNGRKSSDIYDLEVILWEVSSSHVQPNSELINEITEGEVSSVSGIPWEYRKLYCLQHNNENSRPDIRMVAKNLGTIESTSSTKDPGILVSKGETKVDRYVETSRSCKNTSEGSFTNSIRFSERERPTFVNETDLIIADLFRYFIEIFDKQHTKRLPFLIKSYLKSAALNIIKVFQQLLRHPQKSCFTSLIGHFYEFGLGTEINYQLAFEMYARATNTIVDMDSGVRNRTSPFELFKRKNRIIGTISLGYMYYDNATVGTDVRKAFQLFSRAAKEGSSRAESWVAFCYCYGHGVERNSLKAFEMYKKSAESGNLVGQINFGCCFHEGIGTRKDENMGFQWFVKSAEGGNIKALYYVGDYYFRKSIYGIKCGTTSLCASFHSMALETRNAYIEEWRNRLIVYNALKQANITLYSFNGEFTDVTSIGRRPFEKIYEATPRSFRKVVAIKSLNLTADDTTSEIQNLKVLKSHESIIKFYSVTKRENFMRVLEYVNYGTLGQYMRENLKMMNWNVKLSLAKQIVEALYFLQLNEIIYEKLDSEDIPIRNERIKLNDFKMKGSPINGPHRSRGTQRLEPLGTTHCKTSLDLNKLGILLWEISGVAPSFGFESLRREKVDRENLPQGYIKICEGNSRAVTKSNSHMSEMDAFMRSLFKFFTELFVKQHLDMMPICIKKFIKDHDKNPAKILYHLVGRHKSYYTSMIGFFYKHSIGTIADNKMAFEFYLRATNEITDEKNDSSDIPSFIKKFKKDNKTIGQILLANIYLYGKGVAKDEQKAFRLFAKTAGEGSTRAQNYIGFCYEYGLGVEKSEVKAFELYLKAANQGNLVAQCNVGYCFQEAKENDDLDAADLLNEIVNRVNL